MCSSESGAVFVGVFTDAALMLNHSEVGKVWPQVIGDGNVREGKTWVFLFLATVWDCFRHFYFLLPFEW
jgi:TPP-dependent pyruvate/acetoin dehydrogenase alpha subunit